MGSQKEAGTRNMEFLFFTELPRELPGVKAKTGICLLFFLSMGCRLAQVSKKLHSSILSCFGANLATTFWPRLLGATPSLDPELSGPGLWVSVPSKPIFLSTAVQKQPRAAATTPAGSSWPKRSKATDCRFRGAPDGAAISRLLRELLCKLLSSWVFVPGQRFSEARPLCHIVFVF